MWLIRGPGVKRLEPKSISKKRGKGVFQIYIRAEGGGYRAKFKTSNRAIVGTTLIRVIGEREFVSTPGGRENSRGRSLSRGASESGGSGETGQNS